MDSRIKIRDAIQAGKVQEATLMVHQMYPELLDDDRYLFFHLQVSKKKNSSQQARIKENVEMYKTHEIDFFFPTATTIN